MPSPLATAGAPSLVRRSYTAVRVVLGPTRRPTRRFRRPTGGESAARASAFSLPASVSSPGPGDSSGGPLAGATRDTMPASVVREILAHPIGARGLTNCHRHVLAN